MFAILIFAWILTLFHLDTAFVAGINEVFKTEFTTNFYWALVIVIVFVVWVIRKIQNRKA